MPRTIIQVDYGCSREEAEKRAEQVLINDGYCEAEQEGEMIWTKGDISLTGVRAIKVDYGTDKVKLSGWICGLVGGETPLHGIKGAVTKNSVKKTMQKLQMAISKS
ncbi:MAG: hypothetical protein NC293_03940 [Roseburia sp.]|nr:hypothetical protein [Roseburia sp.]